MKGLAVIKWRFSKIILKLTMQIGYIDEAPLYLVYNAFKNLS